MAGGPCNGNNLPRQAGQAAVPQIRFRQNIGKRIVFLVFGTAYVNSCFILIWSQSSANTKVAIHTSRLQASM